MRRSVLSVVLAFCFAAAAVLTSGSASAIPWPSSHYWTIQINWTPGGVHYCLEADANHFGNGDKVQIWRCNGKSNQRWYHPTWSNNYPVYINGDTASTSYHCLNAKNVLANGDPIDLASCSGSTRQAWSDNINDSHAIYNLRVPHPWCLDAKANQFGNGDPIQVWKCNGQTQQQWVFVYH